MFVKNNIRFPVVASPDSGISAPFCNCRYQSEFIDLRLSLFPISKLGVSKNQRNINTRRTLLTHEQLREGYVH